MKVFYHPSGKVLARFKLPECDVTLQKLDLDERIVRVQFDGGQAIPQGVLPTAVSPFGEREEFVELRSVPRHTDARQLLQRPVEIARGAIVASHCDMGVGRLGS